MIQDHQMTIVSIRRRRQCDKCSRRFTTYENVETIPFVVIKKDMTREPYDRKKLEAGVFRSCHKRPISVEQISAVIDKVESEIFKKEEREMSTIAIGEMVLEQLKQLDSVAYIRFASVYREFEDIDTFMKEIEMLQNR